ncbi:hypothetical protein N7493_006880 [Penicillium malachiteum]|uniref:Zn(2)-C6 fungal-type domain-containing protein n=1 Tax=Penicillium malachiteum TaxID=1324776 RepID=A0AAD6HJW7_9EURO|nr:hypothetical protein N7493_006880 [Penicillium malachiteum]
MGGIPYKSLGCGMCKKRKIRCDLGAPECARCIKKGTPCPGYDKGRNFVHHTMVTRLEQQGVTQRPIAQLVGHIKPLALPASFDMSAQTRTQLFSTFLSSFFPIDLCQFGKSDSWYYLMTRFPSMAGESDLLDRSVIALAAAYVGKLTKDKQLKRQGVELYNNAICLMARRLSGGDPPTLDVLYAVTVFIKYEILHTNGLKNCLTHIQGSKALMRNYKYDHSDQLIRAMITQQNWASTYYVTDMLYRKELDWQAASEADGDTPLNELFRLIAETSFLLDDLDRIGQLEYIYLPTACDALLQRCYEFEHKLMQWLASKALELDGKPVSCLAEQLQSSTKVLPWDPCLKPYEFESLETAKTYLLFWVASIIVRRVIYQVEGFLAPNPDPSALLYYASEISRTAAYCLQPKNRMCTGQVLLLAISQANKGYVDCGHVKGFYWSQNMYQVLQDRGFDVAPIVSEIEWASWNEARIRREDMEALAFLIPQNLNVL